MSLAWLSQGMSDAPAGDDWLSPREAAWVARMRFPKRRTEFRLGRFTAKKALALYLGRDASASSLAAIEVGPHETSRLAANRGLPVDEFRRLFTEEDGTTLRNRPDGSCGFLDEGRCSVHPDRPLVCRMFPIGLIGDGQGSERYGVMPLQAG